MKKRALSLLMALVMCLGLAVPAFAEGDAPMPVDEGLKPIAYQIDGVDVKEPLELNAANPFNDFINIHTFDSYYAVKSGTEITVSNVGDDPNAYVYANCRIYTKFHTPFELYVENIDENGEYVGSYQDFNGKYLSLYSEFYLADAGGFNEYLPSINGLSWNLPEMGVAIEDEKHLYKGESMTFTLPEEGGDTIYELYLYVYYPEYDWSYWRYLPIKVDDELASKPAVPTAKTGEQLDKWAVDLVNEAIDAGLMPGHLKGTDLRQNITRTQFADLAVTLYEAMSGETVQLPAENPFSDTSDEAVLKAYAMGFTSGVSADKFGAQDPLTREAAATMLAAVYKKMGGEIDASGASAFADDGSISGWAKDNVYFMAQNGIIAGVGSNKFDPKAMAQSQAALIIALRMYQNL